MIAIFIFSLLVWLGLTHPIGGADVLGGIIASFTSAWLFRYAMAGRVHAVSLATLWAIGRYYVVSVLPAALSSSAKVAYWSLTNPPTLRPGYFTLTLQDASPHALLVLVHGINLSSDEQVVRMNTEERTLLVHCMHAPDLYAKKAAKYDIFMRYLRRVSS